MPKQQELAGMPAKSELAKLCDEFLDLRDGIVERQRVQDDLIPQILELMKDEKRHEYIHENHVFYRTVTSMKLKYRERREAKKEKAAVAA